MEYLRQLTRIAAQGVDAPGSVSVALPSRFASALQPFNGLGERDSDQGTSAKNGENSAATARAEHAQNETKPSTLRESRDLGQPQDTGINTVLSHARVAAQNRAAMIELPLKAPVSTAESLAPPRFESPLSLNLPLHNIRQNTAVAIPPSQNVQPPLSEQTIASHAASTRDERPIIHVTIDRIEVRAPSAERKSVSDKPRTKQAPSVSLAEYLRGRAGGRA